MFTEQKVETKRVAWLVCHFPWTWAVYLFTPDS